jgi:hypothetical membrane protein
MKSKSIERIRIFSNRYPLVGPSFWTVSIQYFLTLIYVATGWAGNYSIMHNTISDLGNTECALYSERFVCSPYFTWMNASFIVLGFTMIIGSALIYQEFKKSSGSYIGFSLMALAGLGTVLVGLFPENIHGDLHFIGAALALLFGNVGLVVIGFSLDLPKWFRIYTSVTGIVALSALFLFATTEYLSFGIGGMERLASHPQTLWLIAFGIYMSRNRYMLNKNRQKKLKLN